ncbi:MAG: phosphoribosyltransferase family protein [Thermomicrobiales bacterium]
MIACAGFAEQFADAGIDVVAGPTTGGIILAFETARQMGVVAAYAERAMTVRTGVSFVAAPPSSLSRVLVVDDILTTGGSVRETLAALELVKGRGRCVGVLVDRSGGKTSFPSVPLYSLVQLDIETWTADGVARSVLPGEPLVKPETTAVK